MNAVRSFLPLALTLLLGDVGSVCPARAQTPASPGGVTIVHPTDDGYEDLLNAIYAMPYRPVPSPPGDATAFRRLLARGAHGDLPLAEKRALLRDERVQSALRYLRDALDKPQLTRVRSDLEQDELDYREITANALGYLRCVLFVKIYVELADGATASAIDTFAESLDLTDALGRWDIEGSTRGSGIIPYTLNPLFLHMDRLSEGNCRRLVSLLKRELNMPNPTIEGLRAEEKGAVERLDKYLQEENLHGLSTADEATILKLRAAGGADWADFVAAANATVARDCNETADALAAYPQSLKAALAAPSAERSERDILVDKVVQENNPFVADYFWKSYMLDESAQRNAQLQLLAVHAAIHQYKWDHNALPPSLDALKIGTLANDPYVGGLMLYELAKDGKSYELSCAGPLKRYDENQQPMTHGKRKPITLPYTGYLAP